MALRRLRLSSYWTGRDCESASMLLLMISPRPGLTLIETLGKGLMVHIGIRLFPPNGQATTLGHGVFPMARNWPLSEPKGYSVRVNSTLEIKAQVAFPTDPNLWGALFGDTTPVRPPQTGRSDELDNAFTYSVARVDGLIRAEWAQAANVGPSIPPSVANLQSDNRLGLLMSPNETRPAPRDRMSAVQAVHDALSMLTPPTRSRNVLSPLPPDFHDALAVLHDFPTVLQRLGLLLTLKVEMANVLASEVAFLQIVPDFGKQAPTSRIVMPRMKPGGAPANGLVDFPGILRFISTPHTQPSV